MDWRQVVKLSSNYPTEEHGDAAEAIVEYFTASFQVDAILQTNSCARGKATRDSCLDIVVLVQPKSLSIQREHLETEWKSFHDCDKEISALRRVGRFSEVHLDFFDGIFIPIQRDEAAGPDNFEIEIGNYLAYSQTLWEGGGYSTSLKRQWLPYYGDDLRKQRLNTVRGYCLNNLNHIPFYIERGL